MSNQAHIPAGYRQDEQGRLVPEAQIKEIDKARDQLVTEIMAQALPMRDMLTQFKKKTIGDMQAFMELSFEQYGVSVGGRKGNIQLKSFDGKFKVQLKNQEHIAFNEQIEAAKVLIDNCLDRWTEGSSKEIKAVVQRAFRTNSQGKLRTAEVLGLRNLEIDDAEWQTAMQALMDSITIAGTTSYINIYQRIGQTDKWSHIGLSLSDV
ncbi:sulfate transporter [Endozoicomonas sp. (ex Bugula neritina AB1)]|nr:sulfate transporter [Endozoicomonas sp. (ex Bugula neritina AB1)]